MHEQFLIAALDQAKLGRGMCAPNPSVGAIAVSAGNIIAQTWHRGAGTAHAEVLLIAQLFKCDRNIILYLTLEPCNHWGKTPPCVDAIIKAGIKKVIYAYRDPNPIIAANNTPELLAANGVECLHYPITAISDFYRSYYHWTMTHKPWVSVKLAHSIDGKIAGINGKQVLLSNHQCAKFTHQQRLYSDIILTTARTINQDDPLLNVRLGETSIAKPIAIIDRNASLNCNAKLLHSAKYCHIFQDQLQTTTHTHPNSTIHKIKTQNKLFNLEEIILKLGELGYHDVWVEAGSLLFNALHIAKLVNTTHLYIVPKILGTDALSAYNCADIFKQDHSITWHAMGDNMIASFDWTAHEKIACSRD